MEGSMKATLREQLVDRRHRLETAVRQSGEAADMVRLLQEVDAALSRIDGDTYGHCEVCHGEVDDEFLAANPLIQYCLCDLTPAQQTALEQDLGLASRIQWALLPKQDLAHAGWEAHFRYEPAGPVSGDYCDLVPSQTDGRDLFFVVGDVSGKGVAASLLMAHLNAMFRSLIPTGLPIAEIVGRANQLLAESSIPSHYATLVCGRARTTGEIEFANAGHCPPMVVGEAGVKPLEATGFPIGMFRTEPYAVSRVTLRPGESLFLYTDGLTEANDRSGREYGPDRLAKLLGEHHGQPPRTLADATIQDVTSFRAGASRGDDLTLLVLRRTP